MQEGPEEHEEEALQTKLGRPVRRDSGSAPSPTPDRTQSAPDPTGATENGGLECQLPAGNRSPNETRSGAWVQSRTVLRRVAIVFAPVVLAIAGVAAPQARSANGGGCSIDAVILEFGVGSTARLLGLGNCGAGIQPSYSWSIHSRPSGAVQIRSPLNDWIVYLRIRQRPVVVGTVTFSVAGETGSSICEFRLSRSDYQQICPTP
jgi:hypothetical protein